MFAITGAAGFIGSNLAHRLSRQGHDLVLADHPLTPAKTLNLAGLEAFRFLDHEAFLAWLDQNPALDGIFHLGACSRTTESDWSYLARNNVEYTRTLWQWCTRHGVRFVYASSAATYGDGSAGFDDRTRPGQLVPLNLYGKSKNDFDAWVYDELDAGRATPPGWAGMKFFNVYGPREAHKGSMASVVFHAFHQYRESGEVRLFKSNDPAFPDGGQRRDFVFVEDCIEHMLWLHAHPAASGIYNSGTGEANTFSDLVAAMFAALGVAPKVRFIEMPAILAGKYQNYTRADLSKLRAAGCVRPPTPLAEGVRATVDSLR